MANKLVAICAGYRNNKDNNNIKSEYQMILNKQKVTKQYD